VQQAAAQADPQADLHLRPAAAVIQRRLIRRQLLIGSSVFMRYREGELPGEPWLGRSLALPTKAKFLSPSDCM